MQEHTVPNSEIPAPTHSTSHCKPANTPSIADEPPGDGINADHHQDSPVFDRTPDANYDSSREAIPLAAVDIQGRLILLVCLFLFILMLLKIYLVILLNGCGHIRSHNPHIFHSFTS